MDKKTIQLVFRIFIIGFFFLVVYGCSVEKQDVTEFVVQRINRLEICPDGLRLGLSVKKAALGGGESYDIQTINLKSGEITILTWGSALNNSASWSQDGQWVTFCSFRSMYRSVWIMDLYGNKQRQVTNTEHTEQEVVDISPMWSPDGNKIAFLRYVNHKISLSSPELWVVNFDGTGEKRLSGKVLFKHHVFTWLPDNKRLAYILKNGDLGLVSVETGQQDIIIEDLSLKDVYISKQGNKLALFSGSCDNSKQGLWISNINGKNLRRIIDEPCFSRGTSPWSPDGSVIAFLRQGKTKSTTEIWTVEVSTGKKTVLTHEVLTYGGMVTWLPTGRELVFVRNRKTIWRINADASNQRQIFPILQNQS